VPNNSLLEKKRKGGDFLAEKQSFSIQGDRKKSEGNLRGRGETLPFYCAQKGGGQ